MTDAQILAFLVLGGMMLLFVWGRIRYDMVAILALLVALAVGIVSPDEAFEGFSDDIVIIVASALVISAAIERSGVIEAVLARVTGRAHSTGTQLIALVGSVTFLSALVKNIGALAMLMPAAFQMAKKSGSSPSCFLMPMAFGSLLGGLITLIGTSPNIIVSRVREQITGEPFGMFDYAPVGLGLAAAGLLFLRFGFRLLPASRRGAQTMGEALDIEDYATEAQVPADSSLEGKTLAEFRAMTDDEVEVTGFHRGEIRQTMPLPDVTISAGDVLILKGEPEALERAITAAGLELEGQHRKGAGAGSSGNVGVIEAVIERGSILAGGAAGRMALHERHGVNLIAVSRRGERITERLRDVTLCPGDVVVLQGPLDTLPERLRDLGCLPLAERTLRLGDPRRGLIPVGILGGAMALTAIGWVPVAVAFFAAAVLILLAGTLSAREAYRAIDWPILIMIGALIPVADAIRTTGASELIGGWLSTVSVSLPAWGAVALIMVAAMAVTPFLNNAATVLVMAPIAATFAGDLGYRPEAFLMATAVGAGCDFLTPIGHQCNTLVMGPGGYRFGDYARLGAPLSLIVVLVGVPLILAVWPLS
ncbi:SLC13 family permease [Allosphingosinicella sp.]|jgi:di/tricarboxylate transporter|uniref:SLC13 family permease n=1 Tax=Allosphingosinicella sp. TaxID=2823234 RepID=UPI002F1E6C07